MTEIERCYELTKPEHSCWIGISNQVAIETVLNLLEEKDTEIERLKSINNFQSKDITKAVDYTFELNKEIEKKDKMEYKLIRQLINEGYCCNLKRNTCKTENSLVYECADCIKQYFERKVETDGIKK